MMVRSFLGLFAPNPFPPLQNMASKVKECTDEIPVLFEAFYEGDYEQVRAVAERISHLEHEVDIVKTRVRDNLPRSVFMPVDRRDLLDVLSALDSIADCAEDVGVLFTLREMEPHEELIAPLKSLVRRVMATVSKSLELVEQFDHALQSGFSSSPVAEALLLIDELGRLEHEADIVQDDLARQLFAIEDKIKPGSLLIWNKIFNKIGDMANNAEKMGNRLRLLMTK